MPTRPPLNVVPPPSDGRVDSHATKDGAAPAPREGARHECPTCHRTCTADQRVKKQAITGPRRAYANDVAESLAMVLGNRRGSIQEWADRITLARQDVQKFVMLDGARVAAGDVEALPAEEHVGYHLDRLERQAKQTRDPAILGAIRQGAQQLLAKIDRLTSRAAASVPQESVNELALVSGAEQGDVLQKAAVLLRGAPTRAQLLDLRAEVIEARDSDERLLQKLNAEIAALPEDAT